MTAPTLGASPMALAVLDTLRVSDGWTVTELVLRIRERIAAHAGTSAAERDLRRGSVETAMNELAVAKWVHVTDLSKPTGSRWSLTDRARAQLSFVRPAGSFDGVLDALPQPLVVPEPAVGRAYVTATVSGTAVDVTSIARQYTDADGNVITEFENGPASSAPPGSPMTSVKRWLHGDPEPAPEPVQFKPLTPKDPT